MTGLYLTNHLELYYNIIRHWGISPFKTPFEDTDTVISAVRCAREGFDVYIFNPCDPQLRQFDYSPLWMWLKIFPVTTSWLNIAGLTVDISFLLSLWLLPLAQDRVSAWIMAAATVSTGVLYAVERGNNDLVLFILAILSAAMLQKNWFIRIICYMFLLVAGLLKYYPLATILIALRERPKRFLSLAVISLLITILFAVSTWHDLVRALSIIPQGSPFADMFGSITVGAGLSQISNLSAQPDRWANLIRFSMILICLYYSVQAGKAIKTRDALNYLGARERSLLLLSALLIVGCFFTAQNLGYRVVHLLLAMPALLTLRRFGNDVRYRFAPFAALALLWSEIWRLRARWLGQQLGGKIGHNIGAIEAWVVRESLWWWLVSVLLAYIIAFALQSEMGVVLQRQIPKWPVLGGGAGRIVS